MPCAIVSFSRDASMKILKVRMHHQIIRSQSVLRGSQRIRDQFQGNQWIYRDADKSLARPGRKQTNVSARME